MLVQDANFCNFLVNYLILWHTNEQESTYKSHRKMFSMESPLHSFCFIISRQNKELMERSQDNIIAFQLHWERNAFHHVCIVNKLFSVHQICMLYFRVCDSILSPITFHFADLLYFKSEGVITWWISARAENFSPVKGAEISARLLNQILLKWS